MIIIPAIDILDQKPVRLYQGDYAQSQCVGENILDLAKAFEKEGASYLHMVDLNGAKEGRKVNQKSIIEVASALTIPVEVGGGIRTMEDVDFYLNNGIARVILGTAAIENMHFLKAALVKYKEKIVVGLDCKKGYVCGNGWLSKSDLEYIDFARMLQKIGVQTLIVTDIHKDGTMKGPNLEMLRNLQEAVSVQIIASGGIKDITHIQQLLELNVYGAISGKAMYAKTLRLKEALALCEE